MSNITWTTTTWHKFLSSNINGFLIKATKTRSSSSFSDLDIITFMNIDQCVKTIEGQLTPARFQHSLGVMRSMQELALIYQLESGAAALAGLVHDAGKELSQIQMEDIARRIGLSLECDEDRDPLFLHGPVSAYVAEHHLGVDDPLVLEAIFRHSYMGEGLAASPEFCWCLRFADFVEPGRGWDEAHQRMGPLIYAGKLADSALALLDWLIPFLQGMNIRPHPHQFKLRGEIFEFIKNGPNASTDGKIPV